jgi:hypothetical protein
VKNRKSQPFTTTDEGFLEKLRISNSFSKLISEKNGFGLIHMKGRQSKNKDVFRYIYQDIGGL